MQYIIDARPQGRFATTEFKRLDRVSGFRVQLDTKCFPIVYKQVLIGNIMHSPYLTTNPSVYSSALAIPVEDVVLGSSYALGFGSGGTAERELYSRSGTGYCVIVSDLTISDTIYKVGSVETVVESRNPTGENSSRAYFPTWYGYGTVISYGFQEAVIENGNITAEKMCCVNPRFRHLFKWTNLAGQDFYFFAETGIVEDVLEYADNNGYNWEYVGDYYPYFEFDNPPSAEFSPNGIEKISIEPRAGYPKLGEERKFTAIGTFSAVGSDFIQTRPLTDREVEWTLEEGATPPTSLEGISVDQSGLVTVSTSAVTPNFFVRATAAYSFTEPRLSEIAAVFIQNWAGGPYTPGSGTAGGAGLPSGSGGGGGTFPSDPGPSLVDRIPNGQTGNDIAQSGLFTMYLMNQQYMNLMGEILWEDNVAIQAIKEIFGNPIDSVISTISYPFSLLNLVQYGAQNLYIGPWNTGLPFQALTKSSFQIDWGTISIPFAWGNFLDYSPHTKMELFLPWGPGYVTIDPNDVSPFSNAAGNFNVSTFTAGSIQVKTNVELGKGTCVHNVIGNNGRVIGSYSGIVGKQVPITALDTGGKALTTISAASSIVGGVVAGSIAAKGAMDTGRLTGTPMKDPMRPFESASYWDTGMISGRASAQSLINTGHNLASRAINSTPITFPRAGTFSDGSSAMTVQTPFLIISRPVQSVPTQYGHYNGYPSNIHYPNFLNIFGYTEISEIHLDNVTATADELQELDTILKGGILL